VIAADAPLVKLLIEKARDREQIYTGAEPGASAAQQLQLDGRQLAYLLNTSFWASLRRQEGQPAVGALTIADRGVPGGLRFSEPIILTQESLVRLAPALGSALAAVELSPEGMPQVWGLLEAAPIWQPVFRIVGPATIVVSADREVIAVLRGGEVHLIKPGPLSLMSLITGFLERAGSGAAADRQATAEHLLRIVAAMHRTRREGSLLLVPTRTGTWPGALRVRYVFDPRSADLPRSRLARLEEPSEERPSAERRVSGGRTGEIPGLQAPRRSRPTSVLAELSQRLLAQIGQLAAVDGAVVLGDDLSLFGFGAEVTLGEEDIDLQLVDAVGGSIEEGRSLASLGTGLHAQAGRFAYHHADCMALVSGRQGTLTVFTWISKDRPFTALTQVQDLLAEY